MPTTEYQTGTEPSTASLVTGIVDDLQNLVKQQVQLTRKEVTEEVHRAAQAAIFFVVGGAVLFFGMFFVGFMLVHLVHWLSAPTGSEPGSIPLWACHAMVGVPLTIIGGILTWLGREKIASINPLDNPATEAMKENVRWATNGKV